MRDLHQPVVRSYPLAYLRRYFPDLELDAATLGRTLLGRWMDLYREPVTEFVEAVQAFRLAVEGIGAKDAGRKARAAAQLSWMASGVSRELQVKSDGTLELRWSDPSLLARLAEEALADAAEMDVKACKACGRVFLSRVATKAFCSKTCKETLKKRKQRAATGARTVLGRAALRTRKKGLTR